jgi:four helix bundle protein
MKTHKDLDVWNEGIELVAKVYEIVQNFPKEEIYGLVEQIKRSAISIPSNIAEGAARNSKKEFLKFLSISIGSISELETQLIIADKIGFLPNKEIFSLIERERYKLLGLIRYLRCNKNVQR